MRGIRGRILLLCLAAPLRVGCFLPSPHAPASALRGRLTGRGGARGEGALSLQCSQQPIVTLKIAMDAKGAVDDTSLTAKRFTSPESLDAVHRLRRDSCAVLVGIGTVCRDNPGLTVRRVPLREGQPQPMRVVLDPSLRIPPSCALMTDGERTVVAYIAGKASQQPAEMQNAKVECVAVDAKQGGEGMDLLALLNALGERGVQELMVEGGPATARGFLSEGLVDRAIIIRAPVVFDGEPVPSGITDASLVEAGLSKLLEHRLWGPDETSLWLKDGVQWPSPSDPSAWP